MQHQVANRLVSGFGRLVGMPALQLDSAGLCELVIDGRWRVTIVHQPSRECLFLHCAVCPGDVVEHMARATLLQMLKSNFGRNGPAGATFVVGPDGGAGLQIQLGLGGSDEQALLKSVGYLLQEAESWFARFAASACAPASATSRRGAKVRTMA